MKQCANAATRAKIKQSVSNVITKVIKKDLVEDDIRLRWVILSKRKELKKEYIKIFH